MRISKDFWKYGTGTSLKVVLKVTERCNLSCKYCYFFYGGDDSYLDHSSVIGDQTVEDLADFLEQAVAELHLTTVAIIVHGGEPLLMKKRRFANMCETFRVRLASKTRLMFSMQTNGVLIDSDWIEIFERYRFSVGISIDGPPEVNDLYRVDNYGRPTHERIVRGLRLVQEAASRRRILAQPGIIHVINPDFDPERVFNHLVHDLNINNISFLLPDHTVDSLSAEDLDKLRLFITRLFEIWLQQKDADEVGMRLFDQAIKALSQNEYERDYLADYFKLRDIVIVVTSDGEICPDDNLRMAVPAAFKSGLFVKQTTLLDAIMSRKLSYFVQSDLELPDACDSCELKKVCRGGHDLLNRYSSNSRDFNNSSVYCSLLTEMYEQIASYMMALGFSEARLKTALGL